MKLIITFALTFLIFIYYMETNFPCFSFFFFLFIFYERTMKSKLKIKRLANTTMKPGVKKKRRVWDELRGVSSKHGTLRIYRGGGFQLKSKALEAWKIGNAVLLWLFGNWYTVIPKLLRMPVQLTCAPRGLGKSILLKLATLTLY